MIAGCKGYDRVHDRVYDSVGDDKSLTENELSGGSCTVEKTDDIVSGEVYDRVPYRLLESAESDKNTLNSRFLNLNCQIVKISHKSELRVRFSDFNSKICDFCKTLVITILCPRGRGLGKTLYL